MLSMSDVSMCAECRAGDLGERCFGMSARKDGVGERVVMGKGLPE